MEGYFGVISVCLSLGCTFGICFFFGIPFNPVSSTMPFLVLAVGVDDAFLLLGAWRMTDPKDPIEERMGRTMEDAGAGITVTSATNFGCFGTDLFNLRGTLALGYFLCPTPAVGDFCILTAMGVFMDYVFQITFFTSLMVYGAKRENEGGLIAYFRCCKKKESAEQNEVVAAPEVRSERSFDSYHERKDHLLFCDF